MSNWQLKNIPPELRELRQWVVWRLLPGKGRNAKPRKVPFTHTGDPASSTDPETWCSFDEAAAALMNDDQAAGVGFVFTDHDPYIGVDLDHCIEDGELSDEAADVVTRLATYTELSPSGTGLHMIGRMTKEWPFRGKKKPGYEIYRSARYFTFTGHVYDDKKIVADIDKSLIALANVWFGTDPKATRDIKTARGMTDRERKYLSEALAHLDPTDEPTWFRITCGLHSTGDPMAFELWDRWSMGEFDPRIDTANGDVHPSYNAEANMAYWDRLGKTDPRDLEHGYATVSTVFSEAKGQGWGGFPPEIFDDAISKLRIMDMVFSRPAERVYLIDNLIPAGSVGGLLSAGGVGKSFIAIALAQALATGRPFCNNPAWGVPLPGSTLILNAEDDREEFARRVYSCLALTDRQNAFDPTYDGLEMRTQVGSRVYYRYIGGEPTPLADGRQITPNVQRLVEYVRSIKDLRLIILDPANVFDHGDENAANERNIFVQALRRLAEKTGATVLIVHHVNKSSVRDDAGGLSIAARGSSALVDGVRFAINLATMTPRQAAEYEVAEDDVYKYVALYQAKANYSKQHGVRWLQRSDAGFGGALETVDLEAVRAERELSRKRAFALAIADNMGAFEPDAEACKTVSLRQLRDEMLALPNPSPDAPITTTAMTKHIKAVLADGVEVLGDIRGQKAGQRTGKRAVYVSVDDEDGGVVGYRIS